MYLTAYGKALAWPGRKSLKMLLIMKLINVLILVCCMAAHARGHAQNVTLSARNASLESILKEIKRQADYRFLYEDALMKQAKPVTVEVKNETLEKVLAICFRDQLLDYKIFEKTIVIRLKTESNGTEIPPPIDIKGRVINEKGEPIEGVSIRVKGSRIGTYSGTDGYFELKEIDGNAVLIFSGANIDDYETKVNGRTELFVKVKMKIVEGEEVKINTGYQRISANKATGSYEMVNREEINRKTGSDILSRLEGVTTSVLFDRRSMQPTQNTISAGNIIIRGLSTLTPNIQSPLVVLDNFPYDGDINNINPNDVESMTILKDAAATSIYGAKGANGVIVITTKQGRYNQPARLSLNTNLSITEKPNLFKYPSMSSSDFIDVETFLFNRGYYNGTLSDPSYPAISPALEILEKRRRGLISPQDSASQLNALRKLDVRNDFDKYIYRAAVAQQYALNLSGGSEKIRYNFSSGFDKGLASLVGNDNQRVSLRSNTSIAPIKNLELIMGVAYTYSKANSNALGDIRGSNYEYTKDHSKRLYPYAQFADATGSFVNLTHYYRDGYVDTAGGGKLLDWHFNPLEEIKNASNKTKLQDIVLSLNTRYRFANFLTGDVYYQYEHSNGETQNYYSPQIYYARNLINLFSQVSGNTVIYRVPNNGILDKFTNELTAHAGRAQIDFNKTWSGKHQVTAIAGGEIRQALRQPFSDRLYGYDPATLSHSVVDYTTFYPQYGNRGSASIPGGETIGRMLDRFVSVYGNAAYTYNDRYTLSVSGRKDASNLFGVDINNKWKPLWSAGGAWSISKESFFHVNAISNLRLRATYGYQGNVNNTLSPYTILSFSSASSSIINQPYATLVKAADPSLSWETIKQLNIGIDFGLFKDRITGSIDLYRKASNNLIYSSITDPTTGILSIARNSASIRTNGMDAHISSLNMNGSFRWQTDLLFSHVRDKVTDYKAPDQTILGGIPGSDGTGIIPIKGSPAYGLYSLPFAGLDPANGDPLGYNGKEVSKDYYGMLSQRFDTANLVYHGSAIPTYFGSLNNSFSFKEVELLVSISYKLGYYFRKDPISYYALYENGAAHPDFAKRWQQPGDEKFTNIPSMVYPISDPYRDAFYGASSANVYKGDHVRLSYIRLGYTLGKSMLKRLPVQAIQLYVVASNLGMIWRSNKAGLDPDYDRGNAAFPPPKNYAFGFNVTF